MVHNSYESFYEGGVSSLDPEYGNFTGYRMSAAQLGFPGSPQTANQVGEVVNAIKQGTKAFEVSLLVPDTAETIPTQHFKEMRALMKLTGVKPSVHGPVIDAAGFTDKGWGGDEGRVDNERRMFEAIEKAHILDPNGNIPVVFHSSNGAPGAEWRPGDKDLGEDKFVMEQGVAINRETGQAAAVKREYKFRPEAPELLEKGQVEGGPAGVLFDAEGSVSAINNGEWKNKLTEVAQMSKHAEEIIGSAPTNLAEYQNAAIDLTKGDKIIDMKTGKELPSFDKNHQQANAYGQMRKAGLFLENAELAFTGAFHQAYKYGTPEQKKDLKRLSEYYTRESKKASDIVDIGGNKPGANIWSPVKRQKLLDDSIATLSKITERKTPQLFQLSEEFAMEKASKTFGNLAMKSYDKFGGNAPILALENMFQGFAFSRAEDLRDLVKNSRKNFADQLVKEKGIGKNKAKKIAEKQLGVTWDVGHLNILRKKGFEEEDIIEQTKVISKDKSMVKHVHLTDNFGYADTHLAPGMGNVPIKAILEELEKTGKFNEMRKITEAGGFVQHFKKSPHPMTMAAFGSPIYGMKSAPYWNQAMDVQGSYFGGYGMINPSQHHSMYGAGFTTMPVELGGQMPGGQSRFGGAPMA
ncbi:MAG: hypothetical protein OEL87_02875 [Nanoarchaeota archaeon]|nr:hypothetical protein [Nanoarchaeota archaeon]